MDLDKLLSKQELCISDSQPPCTAACPIHVDILSFLSEIKKSNFQKAYKILNKKIPFTRVICSVCDHPCENGCLREELGGAIQISKLEKIAIKFGHKPPKKKFAVPRKGKSIGIVGGGVSGLVAAEFLDKKGYDISIYEQRPYIGGVLWDYNESILPREFLEKEIEEINKRKIKINLNTEVGKDISINEILQEKDAVYLGTGSWTAEFEIDPNIFQTSVSKLFAGGGLIKVNRNSIIECVSTGMRAAISIDRFVNKKSLTASREKEGAYKVKLKINLADVLEERKHHINLDKEDVKENARLEAERCIQCQCRECVKACAHLLKFDITPKQYIRQINHNENVVLGNRRANKMINSCTMCGLCEEVCPNSLDLRNIIRETRESMVERNKMPPSAHNFALRDMEYNNSDNFKLLKHEPNKEESKYIFFPGCQLSASAPQYVPRVYKYLMKNIDEGVGLMLCCCGAPAEWAGRKDMFKESVSRLKHHWIKMNKPTFIVACSTCYYIFKTYIPEINIISLWEIIDKIGIYKEKTNRKNITLALHDACTTRHEVELQESVRRIISRMGYDVEELKYSREKTECCGYGGLVYYSNREMAEDFIEKRINESDKDYIAYCFMCRDLFASKGKRTLHILDLIYGEDIEKLSQKRGPTLSQRHENRTKLKIKLLKEFWGEDMSKLQKEGLHLVLSEDVIRKMEDRLILKQHIQDVIENGENKHKKFINPENNHFLTYKKIVNVTYWVEYEKSEQGFKVHDVYRHRMEIMEE
jgi:Fe-S oxidoreductase